MKAQLKMSIFIIGIGIIVGLMLFYTKYQLTQHSDVIKMEMHEIAPDQNSREI